MTTASRQTLVLATRNKGKIEELRRILADVPGLAIDLVGVEEFPHVDEVEETGETFIDNALLKARAVAEATGLPAVADDSGLCVDHLGGAPGVRSARWAGEPSDDDANLALVIEQLNGVPAEQRGAHFACAAALVVPGKGERISEGKLDGHLIDTPRGNGGFGYDPIFVADGDTRTTAELAPHDKDAISHRGRAFRALAPMIAELLAE